MLLGGLLKVLIFRYGTCGNVIFTSAISSIIVYAHTRSYLYQRCIALQMEHLLLPLIAAAVCDLDL